MLRAALLGAQARQTGLPTAYDPALDGDIILCSQAQVLQNAYPADRVVVATTNVGHLSRFVDAALWQDVSLALD